LAAVYAIHYLQNLKTKSNNDNMKLTVCIDLDDTLLGDVTVRFLPGYIKALSRFMDVVPPEELEAQLLNSTQMMLQKDEPDNTLEETFDASFYPGIGVTKADVSDRISLFYQQEFPRLRNLTRLIPDAKAFIDFLFEQGHNVVIATNPLFPRTATLQRLSWAGLPVGAYSYRLISTYESFHFAKPNPAYFSELLGQLGRDDSVPVMIGNSLEMDILPAEKIGIPTFWLTETKRSPEDSNANRAQGDYKRLMQWISDISSKSVHIEPDTIEGFVAELIATPCVMDAFFRQQDDHALYQHPEPGEWSFVEVLGHLRDTDLEANYPRFQEMLENENLSHAGIEFKSRIKERDYTTADVSTLMHDFFSIRSRFTSLIRDFPEELWFRRVNHPVFGPTCLSELLQFIVTHDHLHIHQAYEALHTVEVKS
jgi:FMN phosphatase YigB (HAD superfamily)